MIRFATIGTGNIVDKFLASALAVDGLRYVAVYSRSAETAAAFAGKYAPPACTACPPLRIFTDPEALAADTDIDAVYIASPNSFHHDQAALFLSRGKHVLCEKPVTSNRRELEHLIALSEKHGAILLEAMWTAYTPGFAAIRENLPRLGPIRRVDLRYCQYSSRYDRYKAGIVDNAFNPALSNGALMDIGVYCVHTLVRLFGAPDAVKADALFLDDVPQAAQPLPDRPDTSTADAAIAGHPTTAAWPATPPQVNHNTETAHLHTGIDGAGTILAHYGKPHGDGQHDPHQAAQPIAASTAARFAPHPPLDTAADSFLATLSYAKVSDSRIPSEIQGEDGAITFMANPYIYEVCHYDRNGHKETLYETPVRRDMSGEVRRFIELIENGDARHGELAHSLAAMALMDEARGQMGIRFPADAHNTIRNPHG
ncbi:MAG: Gfo/Idh/MocA family oxidoreductase [Lachnospiraceae bacterium]|nr:Gfo/Idh/MocA family oxidoreductase [Lachnospiraceae bacterium]